MIPFVYVSCSKPATEFGRLIPTPDHVVIVFMENHTYEQVMDTSASYISELAHSDHAALFTNSFALGHPSQPNYLQLFSGSNQGIENNDHPPVHFTTRNLAASLLLSGYTFMTYSEDLPYTGYDGDSYNKYVRKHNPVTNWVGDGNNQVDSSLNQPFTNFPPDFDLLPTVSYVIPNLDHDMHDSTIVAGDNWLKDHFDAYIQYTKTHKSIFILTFDEGNYDENGNHIVTIFAGQRVRAGVYDNLIDHYNLLRTLENMYHLQHAGNAADAEPIYYCWE